MATKAEMAKEIILMLTDANDEYEKVMKIEKGLKEANKDALEWMMTKVKASKTQQQQKQINKQINKQTKMK